jgi:cytochrome c oxidase cbb3-type subunit 3
LIAVEDSMRRAAALLSLAMLAGAAGSGCWREERRLRERPAAAALTVPLRGQGLQPAQPRGALAPRGAYQANAWSISEGQRLYGWFNCVGCHSNGGGGMGPPLMDAAWLYGSEPLHVFESIVSGRPNGMPAFGGQITAQQAWQLVAYVRALGRLQPADAVSPRSDAMAPEPVEQAKPAEQDR